MVAAGSKSLGGQAAQDRLHLLVGTLHLTLWWIFWSLSDLWGRTAPSPLSDASTSTTN